MHYAIPHSLGATTFRRNDNIKSDHCKLPEPGARVLLLEIQVQAHEEIQRLFTATFAPPKTNSNPMTYHFLADSMRSRDIIVLTLRALAKSDP